MQKGALGVSEAEEAEEAETNAALVIFSLLYYTSDVIYTIQYSMASGLQPDARACIVDRAISACVSRCPFLKGLDPTSARELVVDPAGCLSASRSTGRSRSRTLDKLGSPGGPIFVEDDLTAMLSSFRAVHGVGGAIPLVGSARESAGRERNTKDAGIPMGLCPTTRRAQATRRGTMTPPTKNSDDVFSPPALPMASISLSGPFNFPDGIMNMLRNAQRKQRPRRRNTRNTRGSKSRNAGAKQSNAKAETHKLDSVSSSPSPSPSSAEKNSGISRYLSGCSCPPAIVAMRAAVANLKPVRQLRPYALQVRAIALAGATISLNVPMGMLRSKTRKFSPEWVVVVHAIIPFIAALRKACLMPLWGLGLTVAGSVAGQYAGEVLERKRVNGEIQVVERIKGWHPDGFVQWLLLSE